MVWIIYLLNWIKHWEPTCVQRPRGEGNEAMQAIIAAAAAATVGTHTCTTAM